MRKYTYFAVFEPKTNGNGYGVYFPDLLGCVSFGDDFDHAQTMAKEALGLHIYGMEKDGDDIPIPTKNPHELEVLEETNQGYVVSAITIYPDMVRDRLDNRAVKTNTTLPAWLKEIAEEQGVNFSQILQSSLKEHLGIVQ
jgi:predicted RNase H-like HicB family nuclease